MSAAASMSNNSLVGYLSQINTTKLSEDFHNKRTLDDLNTHLKILQLAMKNYDKLFNYTQYALSKLDMLVRQVEKLSREGVSLNNERIKSLQENIKNTAANYATTKNIFNSNNIFVKKVTMDTFINTLTELEKAFSDIAKDIAKLPPEKMFKSSFFGKSSKDKQDELYNNLIGIVLSIKNEKGKFIKLKKQLTEAEEAQRSGEAISKLKARLNKLRNGFNSASSIPIRNISNPQQRSAITKAISNIQRKINTTAKGGATRKRRHSRRRHTRRN